MWGHNFVAITRLPDMKIYLLLCDVGLSHRANMEALTENQGKSEAGLSPIQPLVVL